jgi:type I restriction enzyme M protein
VFLVMHEGWVDASRPRPTIEDKDRKLSEAPDLEIGTGRNKTKYKMDLVPPALIVARYFADDQARVDELNAEAEAATQIVEEYVEEHGGDEGLLSDAVNDKGKLTQVAAKDALKEAKAAEDQETIECAQAAIELLQEEATAKKAAKEAQNALDTATLEKYGDLTEAAVQALVLDDKWAATIRSRVVGEVNALTLDLVGRIQQLGKRYATTIGELDAELEKLEAKVASHLADMGVKA